MSERGEVVKQHMSERGEVVKQHMSGRCEVKEQVSGRSAVVGAVQADDERRRGAGLGAPRTPGVRSD
jgi:hypothetical protein